MNIWYLVIIHEWSNEMALTSIYQCLKLRTKIKWERTTNCMKLKFARSIKRRKESKFTTKVLGKIEMSGVTMVPYLTSNDFTLCLHLLHLNFIIVNFELIFRSGFPSIQQLCQWFSSCLCSHVYESFAVPKSFWRRLENNIANTRFFKNLFHDSGCGALVTDFCVFILLAIMYKWESWKK